MAGTAGQYRVERDGRLLNIYTPGERLVGHVAEREGKVRALSWPGEVFVGEFPDRRTAAVAVAIAAKAARRA